MIQLNNVTHTYGDKTVINDLFLSFDANKLTCLLGSSGSGKTTILRLIAGLEPAKKGIIKINNICVTDNKKVIVPSYKRNIGFIFQDLALWPHFNVFKNISFALKERKVDNIENKVFEMLDFFRIREHADKFPHQLSGGQKQLVAISRSLILNPDILLMDEPLANIDVKLKSKILEYIKEIKRNYDLTIIYVTHDHRETFAIADKIVILNEGKIEDSGTVEQIKKSENKYTKYFLEY